MCRYNDFEEILGTEQIDIDKLRKLTFRGGRTTASVLWLEIILQGGGEDSCLQFPLLAGMKNYAFILFT